MNNNVNIADIVFSYNNRDLILALRERGSNIALQKQSERTSQKREAREEMITKRMGLGGGPGNRAGGSQRRFVSTHAQFVGKVFRSDSLLTHSSSH